MSECSLEERVRDSLDSLSMHLLVHVTLVLHLNLAPVVAHNVIDRRHRHIGTHSLPVRHSVPQLQNVTRTCSIVWVERSLLL